MSKHTAGKWSDGASIPLTARACEDNGFSIAFINRDNTTEAEANAKLISAAPELLSSCETALNYIEAVCFNTPNEKKRRNYADCAAILRAAIAKATGGN